jgi:hypothetical protein
MLRIVRFGVLGALLAGTVVASTLSGCYVHTTDRVVATRPGTCVNAVWVQPYYDIHGRFVPGYWRCQRVTY